MSLENYTGFIGAFVVTNPTGSDPKSEGDNHLRGIKDTLVVDGLFRSRDLGTANGVASLDAGAQVPLNQLGNVPAPTSTVLRGWIAGATLSTAGVSATFAVSAGQAANSTNAAYLSIGAKSKTTGAFVAGSGNGALDTGAIAINTWYHAYAIASADGLLNDFVVSLNATSPALPSGYTLFRRIGSMKTDASSQWLKFYQNGDSFDWDVRVIDQATVALAASTDALVTISSPLGVICRPKVSVNWVGTGIVGAGLIRGPAITPLDYTAQNTQASTSAGTQHGSYHDQSYTNLLSQLALRTAQANITVGMNTYGYYDRRGQDD